MSEFSPLPWFAFNVAEYIADTGRLNAEGHGAYLLLILEIYQKGDPLPDDNEVLAGITRMPVQDWMKQRKFIAPFFKIGGGVWRHTRVEREMTEAAEAYTKRKAWSVKANNARYGRDSAPQSAAVSSPKPPRKPKPSVPVSAPETAPQSTTDTGTHKTMHSEMRDASSEQSATVSVPQSSEHPQDTSNTLSPSERESGEGSLSEESENALQGKEERSRTAMGPLWSDWTPSEVNIAAAHDLGMTDAEIDDEARSFVNNALSKDLMSKNWDLSWEVWCKRFRDWKAKQPEKAAPRVEVNTTINWDKTVSFWIKVGRWTNGIGPEPGIKGCKCPREVLEKHGIDPATGLKARAAS